MQNDINNSLHRLLDKMDRRTLLGRGAAMMGGLFAGLSLRRSKAYGQATPEAWARGGNQSWNVMVAGEAMVSRPFSMRDEPEFMAIVKLLRESDVTYAHLEMLFGDFDNLPYAARGNWMGSYMMAEPQIAKDLKWAGIDVLSLAHNHSVDWGESGILSTMKACEEAGLAHAGIGKDLEEARAPAYVETRKGRVSMISISSGNRNSEWAGLPKGAIPGRPGVNPLRLHIRYEVPNAAAEQLKAIGRELGTFEGQLRGSENEFNITPGIQTGSSNFAFVDGDKYDIYSFGHEYDIEGNLRAIDRAKTMSDLVMVAHHCNISERGRGIEPMTFARDFAKKAVDAGADIYIGHGWHKVLGIEIYKNKPLIHGAGNLFGQNEYIQRVPADSYEAHGHDVDMLTTLHPASYPLHPVEIGDGDWYVGELFQIQMENNSMKEMRLYPFEMGWDISGDKPVRSRPAVGESEHPLNDGVPRMASGANAQAILERYAKISADCYGTKTEIGDGIGIIGL